MGACAAMLIVLQRCRNMGTTGRGTVWPRGAPSRRCVQRSGLVRSPTVRPPGPAAAMRRAPPDFAKTIVPFDPLQLRRLALATRERKRPGANRRPVRRACTTRTRLSCWPARRPPGSRADRVEHRQLQEHQALVLAGASTTRRSCRSRRAPAAAGAPGSLLTADRVEPAAPPAPRAPAASVTSASCRPELAHGVHTTSLKPA
jgi:hypothetical protein